MINIWVNPAAGKELERNNLRNAFFYSNEIMEQRVESFKYSVKIESSYFAAGTKLSVANYPIVELIYFKTASKFLVWTTDRKRTADEIGDIACWVYGLG